MMLTLTFRFNGRALNLLTVEAVLWVSLPVFALAFKRGLNHIVSACLHLQPKSVSHIPYSLCPMSCFKIWLSRNSKPQLTMNTIAVSISILCDKKNKNKNMKIQTLAQNFAEKKEKCFILLLVMICDVLNNTAKCGKNLLKYLVMHQLI